MHTFYLAEVMGMFKKTKIGTSLGVWELEERKLRMLRLDQAVQAPVMNVEETDQENVCEDSRKDIRAAMLEAESKKAEALVAFQNNRRFY
jgi:hypothetical protein